MNSTKWNWILLTILASQLILTSTADTQCSLNDTSMASWQSFFSLFAKASYDKCHSSSSAHLENLTSTIVKQLEEIKQLVQKERAECQKKIEELNSSLCEKIDQLMDHKTSDCPPEEEEITLCNITSSDWRRLAYINMTDPEEECPSGLNEVSNSNTEQRACGRSVDGGCSSLHYTVNTTYTQVCGIARGYQYGSMDGFVSSPGKTIDQVYIDGLSITNGNPRQHLWTYVVSHHEGGSLPRIRCPRDRSPYDFSQVPTFVGDHFYCETGFTTRYGIRAAWSDPLWDGAGCVHNIAHSCDRYGWFHREIEPTQDDIEVRWCASGARSDEDVLTDWLEIWVL